VALQNRGLTDGLGEMTFARAARAEKQGILAAIDEAAGSKIEHQAAIEFGIELRIEDVERLIGIAEPGLFAAAIQQPASAGLVRR